MALEHACGFRALYGSDSSILAGVLGGVPLVTKYSRCRSHSSVALKRVLSRHPLRGRGRRRDLNSPSLLTAINTYTIYLCTLSLSLEVLPLHAACGELDKQGGEEMTLVSVSESMGGAPAANVHTT